METQYPNSIAVAWQTNFDQLTPAARTVLNLCAWLAPDPIPEFLFEDQDEIAGRIAALPGPSAARKRKHPNKTPLDVMAALADLAAYCLITRAGDAAFTMHRLVQEVVRGRIPEAQRRDWTEAALRLVNNQVPENVDDVRTWPIMDVLRPHAALIARRADDAGITEPAASLMHLLGLYLSAKALYIEAEPPTRRALAIVEAANGPHHPNVASVLNNLAMLLQATNRMTEAEPLMRRAPAIPPLGCWGPVKLLIGVDLG